MCWASTKMACEGHVLRHITKPPSASSPCLIKITPPFNTQPNSPWIRLNLSCSSSGLLSSLSSLLWHLSFINCRAPPWQLQHPPTTWWRNNNHKHHHHHSPLHLFHQHSTRMKNFKFHKRLLPRESKLRILTNHSSLQRRVRVRRHWQQNLRQHLHHHSLILLIH